MNDLLQAYMADVPESRVKDAMLYSLLAGGKRIRPNLLFAAAEGYGLEKAEAEPFACAIEMIHTYSLIHDDLPAMDNDDLRRGRPTCHKQFDEATAILAGDGLLTQAFVAASKSTNADKGECIAVLAEMAGPAGMVLGQCLDMAEETGTTGWEELKTVHKYKTGCLLSAPLMIAALLAGRKEDVQEWHRIGEAVGLAFQIQDDILDQILTPEEFGKSTSDEDNGKVTSISLLGREKAEELMNRLYAESRERIHSFGNFNSAPLLELIDSIQNRRN